MKKNGISCMLSVLFAFAALFMCTKQVKASTICNGIYINGQSVSGMSSSEATAMIQNYLDSAAVAEIVLSSPTGYKVSFTPSQVGMKWVNTDIVKEAEGYGKKGNILQRYKQMKELENTNLNYSIDVEYDRQAIVNIINSNMENFNQEAVNYELSKSEDGFEIKTGQAGIIVDASASADMIIDYLKSDWTGESAEIELISVVDEPLGDAGELSQIKDIIGTYTTAYKASGSARCGNVMNGCSLINGTTLYPGEQFSVLEHLVPFTAANGYQLAGSYMNGLVVDTLGGGICQVSSTLYNAVLNAELQVDERQNHSMIVDYVSPSGDAAIAESSGKDFKFTNNTDYPIYIEGYTTKDKTITFNIYGVETRPDNREVKYRSEVLERTVPDYENIIQDASQPIGYTSVTSAHAGIKARYIKEVYVDGVLQSSEEINKSNYKMVPRTIVVGVATDNTDAYNQIQEAAATGSVDQVKAVANSIAAQNAAAVQAAEAQNAEVGDP